MNENNKCQIVWNVTSKCNECCKFCFRKKCDELSIMENKKIVDKLENCNIETLSLSGGEVSLYKDIFELVEYIRVKLPKTKIILNTNGKNVTKEILERILKDFDAVALPIDSTDCDYNERIGRGYYHNENVFKIIEFCNNKIEIKINTILLYDNNEEIEKIYNLIKKYNIKRWKIFRFLPVRDAQKYSNELSVVNEISDEIDDKIKEMNEISNIKISYNKEKNYKTKYFIYPDGSIENSKLEQIGNLLEGYIL